MGGVLGRHRSLVRARHPCTYQGSELCEERESLVNPRSAELGTLTWSCRQKEAKAVCCSAWGHSLPWAGCRGWACTTVALRPKPSDLSPWLMGHPVAPESGSGLSRPPLRLEHWDLSPGHGLILSSGSVFHPEGPQTRGASGLLTWTCPN